ncbi:hypothetical protein GCM10027343_31170 [Noviherbaspirillum agri]
MTKKAAWLTLHGMGEADDNYFVELKAGVANRLGTGMADLAFRAVNYQKSLQQNQEEVWRRIQERSLRFKELRQFFLYGIADAAGLENRKEMDGSVYEDAQVEIARHLLSARREMQGNGPVVVIAQSLGGQVFSSYLYDAQRAEEAARNPGIPGPQAGIWKNLDAFIARISDNGQPLTDAEKWFLAGNTVVGLVTTGCNIPIFVAAHKQMHIKPIKPPTAGFRWLNLYDRHDPLGWPLQPLRGGYETLVEDHEVNVGRGILGWAASFTPLSHTAYWQDDDVILPLAKMLEQVLENPPAFANPFLIP